MATAIDPCAPPPPRCRDRIIPPFKPGISTRRIPLCASAGCDCDQQGMGEWYVTYRNTLDRTQWIKGWAITQLFTRGQVECADSPVGARTPPPGEPLSGATPAGKRSGGWWADSFRGGARNPTTGTNRQFRSGSLLWTLKWSRVTNRTLMNAKAYAEDALSYLVAWGICSRIEINASYVSRNVMRLAIRLFGPGVSTSVVLEGTAGHPDATYLWKVENESGAGPWRMETRTRM